MPAGEESRVPGAAPHLPCIRGAPCEGEHPRPLVERRVCGAGEDGAGPAPELRDDRRDREPLLGVPDRGGEERVERHASEPLVQHLPGVGSAGNGDARPPPLGERGVSGRAQRLGGQRPRGGTGCVQAVQRLAVPHDCEGVAADTVRRRFDHGQGDRGSQRRIDRAAAGSQYREAGLRSQRLARRDHPAGRQHRTALRRVEVGFQVHGDSRGSGTGMRMPEPVNTIAAHRR